MARLDVLLEQSTWWVTKQLRRVPIAQMDVNHAANSAAMLRRGAPLRPGIVLRAIHEEADRFHEYRMGATPLIPDLTPERVALLARAWQERTPLLRALRHRQSMRGPTPPFHWIPEAVDVP